MFSTVVPEVGLHIFRNPIVSNSSFFKYCPVNQCDKFDEQYSIVNLLKSQVTFSSRNNFNDIFDSKINFVKPSRSQLKEIAKKLNANKRASFKALYMGDDWKCKVDDFESEIIKLFDSYLYYCVTDTETNNLMWSHYANSHQGFCIEWDSEKIKAEKVIYKEDIPNFELLDVIKMHCGLASKDSVGINIWKSLLIKLKEWEYESEYRFQMSKAMEPLIAKKGDNFALVKYEPHWIKSIIWGCRTSEETKSYISENLPFPVTFKQAYETRSCIKIRDGN